MKYLWMLFIAGQIIGAGNVNYTQEVGYHEINPIYGKYPSKERVYITKTIETAALYGMTKALPKYKKEILTAGNFICWSFIVSDRVRGASFRFRW